jgi:peptidoglycan/xylan/chitin deacetylase (PgdA/CDA1 family)
VLRELARSLFDRSGAVHLVRCLHRSGARILLYHRFPALRGAQTGEQMAHLRRYYRPRSLTQLGRRLEERLEPEPWTVVVTTDDGYRDFYETAYPILTKYRIPAILFVTTGYLDRECWLWVDRVVYCVRTCRRREFELSVAGGAPLRLPGGAERADVVAQLVKEHLKTLDLASREAKLVELEEATQVKPPHLVPAEFEPCSWDEIREMARGGIEIGAHTVTHPILSTIDEPARLQFEVLESKRRIEQELQLPVRHFAYPNGLWHDFGAQALSTARAHFETAVAAEAGWSHAHSDRHQLCRTAISPQMEQREFERLVAGVSAGVRIGSPRPGPAAAWAPQRMAQPSA